MADFLVAFFTSDALGNAFFRALLDAVDFWEAFFAGFFTLLDAAAFPVGFFFEDAFDGLPEAFFAASDVP